MGLVSWNFSWVSGAGKMGWESCAKGRECFMPELLLAFQSLFLVTENCSKDTALISLQMLRGQQLAVSTASPCLRAPPAPPSHQPIHALHGKEGSCNTWILQGQLATWLLTVAFLRSQCTSPLEPYASVTVLFYCVPLRKVAQVLLCCSSSCFSLSLLL